VWSFDDGQPRFRHECWRTAFDDQLNPPQKLGASTINTRLFALSLNEREFK